MKTQLECKAEQLAALAFCPICGGSVTEQYWDQEHFPGEISDEGFTANPDDKAAARYECGAEISIDDSDDFISRITCMHAMDSVTDALEAEAEAAFADQGGSCRVCGCTDNHACVTDAGPCHWVEDDLCSACAEKEGDTGEAA